RVRATERADIAAHLHDSVLQTLALIQRRADDPTVVAGLARRQERELRAWLYGGESRESNSLAAAVAAEIHEVEDEHGVPVEIVVTGDRTMEEAGDALVKATREAVLNAVRHGRPPVSVFMEVGPSGVEVFVRDHGDGFEMSDIGDDRLGVRESIIGRMKRAEGTARIRRLENGTEVSLTLPPPAHAEPEPEPETPPEFEPETPTEEPVEPAVESEDPATPEPAVTPRATARHTRAASASTKENPR
ncbi:MAG TPA: ATP-binding protein, partial [Dermatophilaceae bacterium]|nr:ATP-binding protein [Dermatophilaceae bacterium]